MASIVLTNEQRVAIEQAKRDGKRRVRMELTPAQQAAMAKADAEVEEERDWIAERSREAKQKHDAQVQRLAAQLREARQTAGLSLSELSERTGMTRQAISRIESGENRNPTISTLVRLAEALNKECVIDLREDA
jgi:ribosome-binding protein aMBF1 (putative translation factor)